MNIEILRAGIKHKDKDKALIYWESNIGYGELKITSGGSGTYLIDAEFMSLDTVFKIIQKLETNIPNLNNEEE